MIELLRNLRRSTFDEIKKFKIQKYETKKPCDVICDFFSGGVVSF